MQQFLQRISPWIQAGLSRSKTCVSQKASIASIPPSSKSLEFCQAFVEAENKLAPWTCTHCTVDDNLSTDTECRACENSRSNQDNDMAAEQFPVMKRAEVFDSPPINMLSICEPRGCNAGSMPEPGRAGTRQAQTACDRVPGLRSPEVECAAQCLNPTRTSRKS